MFKSYNWIMEKAIAVPFTGVEAGEGFTITFGEWKNAVAKDLSMEDWNELVAFSTTDFRRIFSGILNRAKMRVRHRGSRFSTPISDHTWSISTTDESPSTPRRVVIREFDW